MSRLALFPLIALALLPASAVAQGQAADLASEDREPAAMAALDRMGAALRKHMTVNVHSDITAEDVLTTGQKLQYGGTVDIVARRPDKMRLSLKMGPTERQLYYDGKTLTMSAPTLGFYASAEAPGTIREMLEMAMDRYGLEIPLADLFLWGEKASFTAGVKSAFSAGKEMIGGHSCEHYAVRQEGADWQVWMREGEDALPCKLVITMTSDPAMPQFSSVYNWSDQPPPTAEFYAFTPPAGSSPITFGTIRPAAARKGN